MVVKTLTINERLVSARESETILEVSRDAGIKISTLCYLEGLSGVGACRLCLVKIAGNDKLQPVCVTKAVPLIVSVRHLDLQEQFLVKNGSGNDQRTLQAGIY